LVVRNKINSAIQDMPEHPEITELLSGSSNLYLLLLLLKSTFILYLKQFIISIVLK
jgi:hypothetical protein